MASKSLHESSSVTETSEDKPSLLDKSNLQRQAKSHFIVRVGGPRQYADSDFVKPHGSHAHLNLSHVLVADQPQPESSHSSIKSNTSQSETAMHLARSTMSSSSSSSGDEETVTTESGGNPSLSFLKDDQGDRNVKFPSSVTDEITTNVSTSSLDTTSIHSNIGELDSSSWSSISTLDEIPPDCNPPQVAVDEQEKPINLLTLFKMGLLAVRRNAVVEDEERPTIELVKESVAERKESSSGEDVDKVRETEVHEQKSGDLEEGSDNQDLISGESKSAESPIGLSGDVEGNMEMKVPKKESSVELQSPMSGEVIDDVKEAKVLSGSRAAVDVDDDKPIKYSSKESSKSSVNLLARDSVKSLDSEFETFGLQGEDENVEDVGLVEAQTANTPQDPLTSSADTVIHQQDKVPDRAGQDIVPSNGRIESQRQCKSDSSVEVIRRDSSSLDGLAIAEERASKENSQIQEVINNDQKASEKLAQLQEELLSSKEEMFKLREQLDVQLMCEKYVRNEAEEEIQKAVRKISKLQAQIGRPPKLVHKHRKELRRIFQEIESKGGPKKVWTSAEGLQHAIRFLYWKTKDVEKLLHETEQHLQTSQSESTSWKNRAKEQEAAKEQLMADLEERQTSVTTQIGATTLSHSDTCLSYGHTDQKSVPSDIPNDVCWGLQEQTPSKRVLLDKMQTFKAENMRLREQLLDIQSQAQQHRCESQEAKLQADLLKSNVDELNNELIQERLHSQHLSTKLHCHAVSSKNSKLWGLVENLEDVTTPPIEEAVTTLEDIAGLEDWLGHLKAGQQHTVTELDRHKETLQTLQDQISELSQHKGSQQVTAEQSSEVKHTVDAGNNVSDDMLKICNHLAEDKLWQELRQLRDVQLETLTDLEDKDNKISQLQHQYNEVVSEQLQQRAKLEMDLEDNKSEKQEIQDQLEETQQLVSELHRKCVQLGQALKDAHSTLVKQEKTIQDLKDQFATTMSTKQEELEAKEQDNARKRDDLEKRLQQMEAETRELKSSESSLQQQLSSYAEEQTLMQKKNSASSKLEGKFDIVQNELEVIREAEQQFRSKYAYQDKEIHHLHHTLSAMQTGWKEQVHEMVDSALSSWQREKEILQLQLSKAIKAHDSSEKSRKAAEDVNKVLANNAAVLEENCNSLTKQLEKEWIGHQKTVDKLHHMREMLGQENQVKVQMHQDHEDLADWEHQLKEEAQRLSIQLHRIMGNHDTQARTMRENNARLVNHLKMNITPHSYHDSVDSARTKLQVLLNRSRPSSAMPYVHYTSGVQQPYDGSFTQARGLNTTIEESRTMGGAPVRGQRPVAFTSYTESCPFPTYPQGRQ